MVGKIFAGIIMGILVAILASMVVGVGAGGGDGGGKSGVWAAVIGFLLMMFLAVRAQRGRYAWGRGMLLCGLLCFAMPLATVLFTAIVGAGQVGAATSDGGRAGAALGTAVAGTALTVVTGVVGFFLGAIFFVISYFLLRGGSNSAPAAVVAAPVAPAVTKACPSCAETIMAEAKLCRFCGEKFEPLPAS